MKPWNYLETAGRIFPFSGSQGQEVSHPDCRKANLHRVMHPACGCACLQDVFQKPDKELDLEILLKLLHYEHTSGMRLKHYPKASLFLCCLKMCQKSTILLQDLFSCLEGRWNCQRIIEWLKLDVTLKFIYFWSPWYGNTALYRGEGRNLLFLF